MWPWLFFLELPSLTPCLPIGALIRRRRRDLGRNRGQHTKQSLTSAPRFILLQLDGAASAAFSLTESAVPNLSKLSFPVAIVHCYSYLSAQFFFFFFPPYHTHYTRQCGPLAPSYLCFPISPLCCVVLPAFLSRSLITCSENLTG